MLKIPAVNCNERYFSIDGQPVLGMEGERLAELTLTPRIKTHEVLRAAPGKLSRLQDTPARAIHDALAAAGGLLGGEDWRFATLSKPYYCHMVSESTGAPVASVAREIDELAGILERLGEITRVQLPPSEEDPLDTHRYSVAGHEIGLFPAGKSLLVKVPGNVPTIAIYWLLPLALKRPVIVVPPVEDPFTHLIVLDAIQAAAPWLSSCVDLLPCEERVWVELLGEVDQAVIPEGLAKVVHRSPALARKTHLIHHGRSKLLLAGPWTEEAAGIAARRMLWNHGRTCTGLTSVVVAERGRELCERTAERVALAHPGGFAENAGRLPLFPVERARRIDAMIEGFIARGEAEDVTRRVTGRPRLAVADGRAMLFPTVLWIARPESRAFGLELPFPFVTVAEASGEDLMVKLARDTLILGVLGASPDLLRRLCHEPSILKVFAGGAVERGYHPLDPHEGYMADFLYQKKAVFL
ncbi:MAG: hypothetical protein IT372_38745 [Polyangiaceae bacterium]|nr:hypothetical protein [Polyangiaceae bacterium]